MRDGWDEDFDEEDENDDGGYIDCPHCGESMLEAADYCPSCDRWISGEDRPKPKQPLWFIIGAALCLAVAATWILMW